MKIIVDYDNLHPLDRENGLPYFAQKMLSSLDRTLTALPNDLTIRIYGGWYADRAFTRSAQAVAADIATNFPMTFNGLKTKKPILVRAEQAVALEAAPSERLYYTYRQKSPQYNLKVLEDAEIGCTETSCPRDLFRKAFRKRKCPQSSCPATNPSIIVRSEQKLVDTMMAIDLGTLAESQEHIVLASADHDLWPAILALLYRGIRITHLLPNNQTSFVSNFIPQRFGTYTFTYI